MHAAFAFAADESIHLLALEYPGTAGFGIELRSIDHNQLLRIFDGACKGKTQGAAIHQLDIVALRHLLRQHAYHMHTGTLVAQQGVADAED